MKLTKDDFAEAESVYIIIKKPIEYFEEIRDQILQNQEDAERLDALHIKPELLITNEKLIEITHWKVVYQRLKKERKEHEPDHQCDRCQLLQNILDGKE